MKDNQCFSGFSSFSILILFALGCLIGTALIPLLSVQLFPGHSYASLNVSCNIPSTSPQITDAELTSPLESTLSLLKGIKKLSSVSGKGNTSIDIELDKFTNPEFFRFEAAVLLRQLYPKLPKDASYPQLSLNMPEVNKSFGNSIINYRLNGPGGANELIKLAKKIFIPEIAKLNGVKKFSIEGGKPDQIVISTNKNKMESFGVSSEEVYEAIHVGTDKQDLGLIRLEKGRYHISIEGSLTHEQYLANYPIPTNSGRIVQLKEIATITTTPVSPRSFYRINGEESVTLSFYPKEHVNNINLADQIKRCINELKKTLPVGYRINLSNDDTALVKTELNKIYLRTFLSVFILLIFIVLLTRNYRYIAIIIISLFCNILISFIFYYLFKLEIHLYSLAGITISLGMIIDNVIIITEDIRHTGRNHVFRAILASTAISLGVLVLVFFLDVSQQINLIDFALAIVINLIISIPIAYFFIPALLQKIPIDRIKGKHLFKRTRSVFRLNNIYGNLLIFMLRYRRFFLLFFLLCFGLPLFMLPYKIESQNFWAKGYNSVFGSEFYNQNLRGSIDKFLGGAIFLYFSNSRQSSNVAESEKRTALNLNISMPNGATIDQMNEVCLAFEKYLKNFNRQLDFFVSSIPDANNAYINIIFKKTYESGFPFQLKQLLETKAISFGSADFQVYGVGRGFNNEIDFDQYDSTIQLKGYNYNDLQQLAFRVKDSLETNPRVRNVQVTTAGRGHQKPYHEFVINIIKSDFLKVSGISRWDVSKSLHRLSTDRSQVGYVINKGKYSLPVILSQNDGTVPEKWQVHSLPMALTDSTRLDLNSITTTSQIKTGDNILKEDQSYLLNTHYQFIGTGELNTLVKNKIIEDIDKVIPFGYSIMDVDNGPWLDNRNNYDYLWHIVLVFVIIFMICAVLLESLRQPLAVVIMVPFSFIGVFLSYYLFDLQFDQGGYASLLMLAGIVTNASLYVINDVNFIKNGRQSSRKIPLITLYIKAFNAKIVPILITTFSAILSMIPFLINGDDKGFWFTLSLGTIGGLLFSILGVFFLLPLFLINTISKELK